MMKINSKIWLVGLAALVFAGCGEKEEVVAPEVTIPAAFVDALPAGTPTPIPEARTQFKPGDEVLLAGKVMGTTLPFVEGRAVFVLGDEATITPCSDMEEDHCAIPWDACCDPADVRRKGTATVQLLGEDGKVLAQSVKGVKGLKELSRVTVAGVVAPQSTPEAMIVNAHAIYVAAEK